MATRLHALFGFLALCLMLCSPPASGAAEIFVSPSGSDSGGNGSEAAPYATPQHALRMAQAGDMVTLRGGTYVGEELRMGAPNLTLRSYPGEWALVHNPDMEDITLHFRLESSGSRVERLEITGGFYAIKTESNWDWGDASRYGASNITISDCRIHDSGNACIKITPGCDDVTIERCEIYNSGITSPGSAEAIDNVNGDRMTVRQCYMHDLRGTCMYAKGGATGLVVDRCLAANCEEGGILIGFDTSPEWFDTEANPGYYENLEGTVTNCIVMNTQYAGIGMFAARNPRAYNNTLINTAQAGHAALYFGLTYQDWEPQALRPPTVNPILRNNIVVNTSSAQATAVGIRYSDDLGGMRALEGMPVMSNNIYHWSSGQALFEDNRPGSEFTGVLEGWQGHIGGGDGSRVIDPGLDSNYHLTAGSPAINAGSTWTQEGQVAYDYDGGQRQSPFDIGADEYQAGDPLPVPPQAGALGIR